MQMDTSHDRTDPFASFEEIKQDVLERGGQYIELPSHVIVHIPGKDRLVACFDNRACVFSKKPRRPWGDSLVLSQGWGCLGVMALRQDWFRSELVFAALEDLVQSKLLPAYKSFSLYGNSMGGYGALAFAKLFPDPIVVTFNPQTSLEPTVVPFERRFEHGRSLGSWDGDYVDGVAGSTGAEKVYVFYDPMVKEDKLHAVRLDRPNAVMVPCPWLTHPFMSMLASMQLLRPVAIKALAGNLTRDGFYRDFRRRRSSERYMYELLTAAVARNHVDLARKALARRLEVWPSRDPDLLTAIVNPQAMT